jgi:hypothetical protein
MPVKSRKNHCMQKDNRILQPELSHVAAGRLEDPPGVGKYKPSRKNIARRWLDKRVPFISSSNKVVLPAHVSWTSPAAWPASNIASKAALVAHADLT